ncbi:lytic transglycosylase domain-containing protein [Pyruvatibacter sp.]|uniref:lytic transglycosylase domain-containing protein n=2 Tax=Pyruvatibacter sp. TaxID=1981328 RepID=UPI003265D610
MMTAVANIQASGSTTNVVAAVKTAAASTGADFDYLLQTAVRESSLNPAAKAKTSSASGLFQFIEQTWLGVVKRHGAEFGLEDHAAAIDTTARGRHKVTDSDAREAILALRHDPEVSALMAGALTKESQQALENGIGREATSGELYTAHFLGAGGAIKLINAAESDPRANASALFPGAAKANKSIFYNKDGSAKTVSQVYDRLTRETDIGGKAKAAIAALKDAPQQVASVAPNTAGAHQAIPLVVRTQSARHSGPSPLTMQLSGSPLPGTSPVPTSRPALVLTPAVMDVLASLDPLPSLNGDNSADDRRNADNDDYKIPARAFGTSYADVLRGTLA